MATIFNNRHLAFKISFLTVAIGLSCLYSYKTENSVVTLAECLANPDRFDNVPLSIGGGAKIGIVHKDRFQVVKGKNRIWVKGTAEGLVVNEYINLKAVFHKEGYLELEQAHLLKLRRLKMVLSVIPLLVITGLFLRTYRVRFKWPVFMER